MLNQTISIFPTVSNDDTNRNFRYTKIQEDMKKLCENGLTKREIQALSFWISGCSLKETANILKISLRTAESYRRNIKNKLNIQNRKILYTMVRNLNSFEFCIDLANYLRESKH